MVFVMIALIIVVPACKSQSDNEPDDIQLVSMVAHVEQFDGFAGVTINSVVNVKTSDATIAKLLIGTIHLHSINRTCTAYLPSTTNGEWVAVSLPNFEFGLDSGTYEATGEFSFGDSWGNIIGKTVTGTCTIIVQ